MPYLQSAAIEAVAYDETARLLRATFRADGRVMLYENVPREVYDSLIFSDSIGAFFREHVEGCYPARQIVPGTKSG
ncbi:MAG: KTSC domain-containing protein [Rhizomicrobium sp.]